MNVNGKAPEGMPAMRDERGRVMPGSRLGVGNLGQHHRGELRRALITAKTPEDIRRVGAKLVEEALAGNVYAAKVWLDHVLGRPLAAVEISGPNGGPLDMVKIVTTIMVALGNDQAAQVKVGQALRQLEISHESASESSG
jgi:hypothetical protein